MSTRATYQIDFTTFYIHHDGYPTGAASYFMAALQWKVDGQPHAINSGYADLFIRANDGCELTKSHAAHSDTEYRYTVTTHNEYQTMRGKGLDELTVKVETVGWSEEKGRTLFDGPLADFIATAATIESEE